LGRTSPVARFNSAQTPAAALLTWNRDAAIPVDMPPSIDRLDCSAVLRLPRQRGGRGRGKQDRFPQTSPWTSSWRLFVIRYSRKHDNTLKMLKL